MIAPTVSKRYRAILLSFRIGTHHANLRCMKTENVKREGESEMQDFRPYQISRNMYWEFLTEFKDNYGYLNRSHTFDNFKLFVDLNQLQFEDSLVNAWNWYFC